MFAQISSTMFAIEASVVELCVTGIDHVWLRQGQNLR